MNNLIRNSFLITLFWVCCHARYKYINYYVQKTDANGNTTNFSYDPASPNLPANWEEFARKCGGQSQSPINIKSSSKSMLLRKEFGKLKGIKWTEKPTSIIVENDGITVLLVFQYADESPAKIISNGVVYEMAQMHFHFGKNSQSGSEHRINNRAYAMEGHAVFFNTKYETIENALSYSDGLTVISRFYKRSYRNIQVKVDFSFLEKVCGPDETYTIDNEEALFSIADIMGPLNMPYYMYQGSLTTPDCSEAVTWRVGAYPLRISGNDVSKFRKLRGDEGLLAPNIRPLQKRNGRIIFYYRGGYATK